MFTVFLYYTTVRVTDALYFVLPRVVQLSCRNRKRLHLNGSETIHVTVKYATTKIMIENAELVMQMLEMYQMYKQQVPVELEEYLRYVAKTGNTLFQWTLVKPFIREKILNVIAEFAEHSSIADIPPYPNVDPFNYEAMKTVLLERFDTFNGPPFTIQRLCELLSCPRKEYSRVDKFMRAVEKNILVVSTCELRVKRDETVVNGVPDRWENGKDSDINMDLVDKSNVISDIKVLNDNETVESLLDELESMKTPITTKLDEIKTDHKDHQQQDHLVAQVMEELEPDLPIEEPKLDTQVIITDTSQTQITDTTEIVEQVDIVGAEVVNESVVDPLKEQLAEKIDETQPVQVNESIVEKPVEELNILSNDVNLENIEQKTEEPSIAENNKLEQQPELISTKDSDRVEGSIIHQTPDSDNKVELDIPTSQPEVELDKSNKDVESMDVQVEDATNSIESEVNCDKVQEKCTESTINEDEKPQEINEPMVNVPPDVPDIELISTQMDIETKEIKNDTTTKQETVSLNEEETKITEPDTVLEEPQEQDENKLTESK